MVCKLTVSSLSLSSVKSRLLRGDKNNSQPYAHLSVPTGVLKGFKFAGLNRANGKVRVKEK